MPAILLSLSAAILYGAADFCGGLATRRTSMFSVAVISQLAGFVLLLVVLPFFPRGATAADFGWGALAGLCGGIGLALLYHALSIGKMGVVSPITAVLAAALPLGIGVARGEHLSHAQVLGIAMALVAIVLISVSTEPSGTREISTAGVKEAIASGLVLGGFYLFLSYSRPAAGLESLVTARLASAALVASLAFATGKSLVP
ncbi:MAG TPA: EamA family transporter, partial [Candidatus Baltobacteraceae bacterium]|nr:EamA family transporter [Candidatus Baltobacteraceae bacterium]